MSKYEEHQSIMTDSKHLIAALTALGLPPEHCPEGRQLVGFQGDQRPEKAHIILSRAQCGNQSNEVGFYRDPETKSFRAIISQYDSRKFDSTWLGALTQSYQKHHYMAEAKKLGCRLISQKDHNGNLQLKFGL